MKRRSISALLILAMLVSMLPFAAIAAETDAENEELLTQSEKAAEEETESEETVEEIPTEPQSEKTAEEETESEETVEEIPTEPRSEEAAEEETESGEATEEDLQEPECLHTETEVVCVRVEDSLFHAVTEVCVCGEVVDRHEEECLDEDEDGRCDLCDADVPLEPILGDVDGDREVTEEDAVCILRYVAGLPGQIDESLADVDGDGFITAMDAMLILRFSEGLIDRFPKNT